MLQNNKYLSSANTDNKMDSARRLSGARDAIHCIACILAHVCLDKRYGNDTGGISQRQQSLSTTSDKGCDFATGIYCHIHCTTLYVHLRVYLRCQISETRRFQCHIHPRHYCLSLYLLTAQLSLSHIFDRSKLYQYYVARN